jgi:hypothetical protein
MTLPRSSQVPSLEQVMEWSAPMLSHRPMNARRPTDDRSPAASAEEATATGSNAMAAQTGNRFMGRLPFE